MSKWRLSYFVSSFLAKELTDFSLNFMKHPSKAQHFQFLLNFFNFSKLNAMRNYQKEINVICVTQELQIMANKYEALLKTYRPRDDLSRWWVLLVWCRKLPIIGGTAELLLIAATDCTTTAHTLKTSSISSGV